MVLRTYVRGDLLLPEIASKLSKAGLKKYWLVDDSGNPIGKPFNRRWEVELVETAGEYKIITGKIGRPKEHATEQDRKKKYDRNRASKPERKRYLADKIKEKRAQKTSSETRENQQ